MNDDMRLGWQLKMINIDFEVALHGAMGTSYDMGNDSNARSA